MPRKREVLSVTVTAECIDLLNKFVERQCANGWATNKSMVVNNAIIDFIQRSQSSNAGIPALAQQNDHHKE
jgi:predicted transcriptional regulator